MAVAINNSKSRSDIGGNKLRTYKLFKRTFETEQYCKLIMSPLRRSVLANFRCGVAPLHLETGLYEGLLVNDRICPVGQVHVEDETHVLLNCDKYHSIREILFEEAVTVYPDFNNLSDEEHMIFLFSNLQIIRACDNACCLILQCRSVLLHK